MIFDILETKLQTKLYGAGPMRIERVQKGSPGDAIGSATLEPGGIHGAGIATDDVVSTAARVIGIVDPELSVIKNIKGLSAELKFAGLPDLEMFQQRHIEVDAAADYSGSSGPRLPKVSPRGATNWEGLPMSGPKLRELLPGEGNPCITSG